MSKHIEWVFKDGKKYPAGNNTSRGVGPRKVMESTSSNGLTRYLTILWNDGVLTCDCRGWAILKKDSEGKPKERTCKHCKEAAKDNFAAMTPVDDFVPAAGPVRRPQLDLSKRQLRNIRIR